MTRRISAPVMSQREIAENALRQAEAYVPRDEWGRRGKARNIKQIKDFLENHEVDTFLEMIDEDPLA